MTPEQEVWIKDIRPGRPEYPQHYAAKLASWLRTRWRTESGLTTVSREGEERDVMTTEQANELRAKVRLARSRDYISQVEMIDKLCDAIESLLPAPPEPMWPEWMAEWTVNTTNGATYLRDGGSTRITICTGGDDPSPAQAARLAAWCKAAPEVDATIVRMKDANERKDLGDYNQAEAHLFDLHDRLRAAMAEAGRAEG